MMGENGKFLRPMLACSHQEVLGSGDGASRQSGKRGVSRSATKLRSGYYIRSLVTRVGQLELEVPQDRNGRFSTDIGKTGTRCWSEAGQKRSVPRSSASIVNDIVEIPASADTIRNRTEGFVMTNVGKWTPWYQRLEGQAPWPYGDTTSYEIGAGWLADSPRVEDWGCGAGWLSTLIQPERYRGIDGTPSPRCAEIVDLVKYRSSVPGIFMRHILEHNYEWARILDNALASFTQRMALILFTPEQETTQQIAFDSDIGVPDIAFRLADITDRFPRDVTYTVQRIQSGTQYGCETILLLERHPGAGEAMR